MLLQFAYLNSIPKNLFKQTSFPNLTEKRWRDDGKCGWNNTLTDDAIAECNPNEFENKPCCSAEGRCVSAGNMESCRCSDCVDYRVVKKIRESGESCIVTGWITTVGSDFLKNVCFDNTTKRHYFKCVLSDVFYKVNIGETGLLNGASEVCENDPFVYQACGFNTEITNTDVLCGAYFWWAQEQNGYHKYIECTEDGCGAANRDAKVCDDKCDSLYCKDESNCNGYQYGVFCDVRWSNSMEGYVSVHYVCNGHEDCYDGSDEQDCAVTDSTVYTCTHYSEKIWYDKILTVPIHNYTRCSVVDFSNEKYPYCLNYLDQTNCSDMERVGGYCKVNGYLSTVSKYMVCLEKDKRTNETIKLCDDGFQNKCISPSHSNCKIHKHKMCDRMQIDCPDGSDEYDVLCRSMSLDFTCIRRFGPGRGESRIPLSWIMDNEEDCKNGEDENPQSGNRKNCSGEVNSVVLPDQSCHDFFRCPGTNSSFVPLLDLCDEVESCGNGAENNVCRVARDFPVIDRDAPYNGTLRDLCNGNINACEVKEFKRPSGDVFGEQRILLSVPTSKVNCDGLFGENYVFLSCMNLCKEVYAQCPLNRGYKHLKYDSCPEQYPNRVYTLRNNSFLTFVEKPDNDRYHQDFFECQHTGRCIRYNQVCDLVDDCGDLSDEVNCINHMTCYGSKSAISFSQKCDGFYDCFDLSDECNYDCGREILDSWVLKIICWIMGLLAVLFNVVTVVNGAISLIELV